MSHLRLRRHVPAPSATEKPPLPVFEDEKVSTPSDLSWVARRHALVDLALANDDLEALVKISAMPGGFGSEDMRRRVWPALLNAHIFFSENCSAEENDTTEIPAQREEGVDSEDGDRHDSFETAAGPSSHPDEAQVLLDTRRAFVAYPKGLPPEGKLEMQADLQDLIVGVLRKYPTLSYFQGYHDIVSVLYLTFVPHPPTKPRSRTTSLKRSSGLDGLSKERSETKDAIQDRDEDSKSVETAALSTPASAGSRDTPEWRTVRKCAEVISVCRVRDAMGKGLEPMMGLLRILRRILTAADPELARFSSFISPVPSLPFFALSWILCLFSHDIDILEPIQRMFDFLLGRNPISAIYLAVAILIAKKPEMFELAKKLGTEGEQDPSLLHPLFARLPPLYPDTPEQSTPTPTDIEPGDDPNPYEPIPLSVLFFLSDELMAKFPWDGEVIRGKEIMGEGSVVSSYALEMAARNGITWNLSDALNLIDRDVVKPGAGMADDDDEADFKAPVRRRQVRPLNIPRNMFGTTMAVSIVIFGLGMAIYGVRAGGPRSDWTSFWAVVVRSWVEKTDKAVGLSERVCQGILV